MERQIGLQVLLCSVVKKKRKSLIYWSLVIMRYGPWHSTHRQLKWASSVGWLGLASGCGETFCHTGGSWSGTTASLHQKESGWLLGSSLWRLSCPTGRRPRTRVMSGFLTEACYRCNLIWDGIGNFETPSTPNPESSTHSTLYISRTPLWWRCYIVHQIGHTEESSLSKLNWFLNVSLFIQNTFLT